MQAEAAACGSSAESGVAPLTCATHGPGATERATSAIARSGTQSRTRSGSSPPTLTPRSPAGRQRPSRRVLRRRPEHSRSRLSLQFRGGYRAVPSIVAAPRGVRPDAASRIGRAGSGAARRLAAVRVRVGDVRLYFDVDGAKFVPDGPRMRERPTVILLHPGPGFDHALYKVIAGPQLQRGGAGRLPRRARPRPQRPLAVGAPHARHLGRRPEGPLRRARDRAADRPGARVRLDGRGALRRPTPGPPGRGCPAGTARAQRAVALRGRLRPARRAGGRRGGPSLLGAPETSTPSPTTCASASRTSSPTTSRRR